MTPVSLRALAVAGLASLLVGAADAREAPVLFDGKTLRGWKGSADLWRVEGGEIVGTIKDKLPRNEFLISDKPLKDFRLIVDVELKNPSSNNSGIQFRSKAIDEGGHPSVAGYQADIGGKEGIYWGQLYDEHGRGWLWTKSCGVFVKPDDWNTYEVLAVGTKIQTAVNGHKCVDLDDPKGHREGVIALQLHSGGAMEVRFRRFRLEVAPEARLKTLALLYEPKRVEADKGLTPEQAVAAMSVPEGFRVSLIAAEPDVRQPVAVAFDHRGRLWIAEAYSYPQRREDADARDRILILEDGDADGRFETRKVFYDKLNLVSGLEVGFGGIWVGAAPHLLFIPDRDGDDVPDGKPEVLLDGWGYQDTHETLNSFVWGPDGWLYGNHGVFTHSKVGKPGTADGQRMKIDAAVWRYHPTRHEFEVFAHGGSNQWGLDFDDDGQAFITTCRSKNGGGPITHVVQGAYYWRQAGSHEYPHVYEPMLASATHDHGTGGAGEPGSDEKYGGHAHVGTMIYLGDQWPERYRNALFTHNLHGGRVNHELNERAGSGYLTRHAPADLLFVNDPWFVGVDLLGGPDGAMYMIDWYDRQRCHHRDVAAWDRSNGRVYRVDYGAPRPQKVDLARLGDRELVELQLHRNDWQVRMARRLLQERAAVRAIAPEARKALREMLVKHPDRRRRLRALWALHATGGLDEGMARRALASDNEFLRGFAVQLAHERRAPSRAVLTQTAAMARRDPSPVVRRYLASTLQRLPAGARWPMLEALAARAEDAGDRNVPALLWFAAEPLVLTDLPRAMRLAGRTRLPLLQRSIYRRAAMDGRGLEAVVAELGRTSDATEQRTILEAMARGLEGRGRLAMPAGWESAARPLLASLDPGLRRLAETVGAQIGDRRLLPELRRRLADRGAPEADRRHAFDVLLAAEDAEVVPVLQELLDDTAFRGRAVRALARFDHPQTGEALLARYGRLAAGERTDAIGTLVTRPTWALALVEAVERGRVPQKEISPFVARQMAKLDHPEIAARLAKVWGTSRGHSQEKAEQIARYKKQYSPYEDWSYDARAGRVLFGKLCAPCHKLFGEGAEIGPDLTGSNRDLAYLLENIVDPGAVVGRDYQLSTIKMRDGRMVSGMIHAQNEAAVTVRSLAETLTLPRREIEAMETSDASMMPEGLIEALGENDFRSLMKYLMSPVQVPLPEAK